MEILEQFGTKNYTWRLIGQNLFENLPFFSPNFYACMHICISVTYLVHKYNAVERFSYDECNCESKVTS